MALTDNLVAYWKFDESSGNAADATGNSHTATNENSIPFVTGKINSAASFNGTNQYFQVYDSTTSSLPTDLADFASSGIYSFSAWVKTTQSSPSAPFSWTCGALLVEARNYSTEQNNGWAFGLSGNKLSTAAASSGSSQTFAATTSLNDESWHHVVVVVNGTNVTFYVDGASDGTATFTIGTDRSLGSGSGSNAKLVMGGRTQDQGITGANFYSGYIDEIGIWSRALTSSEVSQLYNGGAGSQYPFITTTGASPALLLAQLI